MVADSIRRPYQDFRPFSLTPVGRKDRAEAVGSFPLLRPLATAGVVAGLVASAIFGSLLAGFGFFVLFVVVGAVWRPDEPPVLPYCLGFQWLSITSAYLWLRLTGFFPGDAIGDLDRAILLSLLGLLVLTLGVLVGSVVPSILQPTFVAAREAPPSYSLHRLFWLVIGAHASAWFFQASPASIAFGAAQIIARVLDFRTALLMLLFIAVFRQRRGYRYAGIALIFAILPTFTSAMSSGFSTVVILFLLALLAEWRPWMNSLAERQRTRRVAIAIAVTGGILLTMALLWVGAIKPVWRPLASSAAIQGSPVERLAAFGAVVEDTVPTINLSESIEELVGRVSSGVSYFSFVIERVPSIIPHENGALLSRAFQHVTTIRALNPDKPNLGSDSWMITMYAGRPAAGAESNTSVGLGYMGEFYIDFGEIGMMAGLLFYGLLFGILFSVLKYLGHLHDLSMAFSTILMFGTFTTFEGSLAKSMGALISSFFMYATLIIFVGPIIYRFIAGTQPAIQSTPQRPLHRIGLISSTSAPREPSLVSTKWHPLAHRLSSVETRVPGVKA